jgi:hypothetical protein
VNEEKGSCFSSESVEVDVFVLVEIVRRVLLKCEKLRPISAAQMKKRLEISSYSIIDDYYYKGLHR